jgi:hypothetical protein
VFSFIVPHCLFQSLPLHHSVAHVDNELDKFWAFAFKLLSLVGIAEGKKGLLLSFSSGHIPRGNVKSPKSLATWRDYAHKTFDKWSTANQEIVFCSCEFFSIDVQRRRRQSGVLTQNSKIISNCLKEVDPVFSIRSLQCLLTLHKSPIRGRWCESRSKHDSFSEKLIQLQISQRLTPLRDKLHML